MGKEEIEKAKEILNNPKTENLIEIIRIFKRNGIENYCITRKETIETLSQYIEQLESRVQAQEMEHKYDVNMIDEVKGEAVQLYNKIERLNKIIDEAEDILANADVGYYKKEVGGEILGMFRRYNKEDWKQYFEKKVEGK